MQLRVWTSWKWVQCKSELRKDINSTLPVFSTLFFRSTLPSAQGLSTDIWLIVDCFWRNSPQGAMASSFTRFLDHIQRNTTVGRTPLDEWSARCRDLYLTTHNTHNRQTSMLPVRFEPTISAGERLQIYALDRAANGTGCTCIYWW
jgi:hypothetical protein